jgi:diphthine-ammonia ligase
MLLQDMIDAGIHAVLIKISSLGLTTKHLGKSLAHMQLLLLKLQAEFGCNACGEGGEFESFTLDCPAFVNGYIDLQVLPHTCSHSNTFHGSATCQQFIPFLG